MQNPEYITTEENGRPDHFPQFSIICRQQIYDLLHYKNHSHEANGK